MTIPVVVGVVEPADACQELHERQVLVLRL